MANEDIKRLLKIKGVKTYELADYFGVHDNSIYRKFRHELSDGEKAAISIAIEVIARDKKEKANSKAVAFQKLFGISEEDYNAMSKDEIIDYLLKKQEGIKQ